LLLKLADFIHEVLSLLSHLNMYFLHIFVLFVEVLILLRQHVLQSFNRFRSSILHLTMFFLEVLLNPLLIAINFVFNDTVFRQVCVIQLPALVLLDSFSHLQVLKLHFVKFSFKHLYLFLQLSWVVWLSKSLVFVSCKSWLEPFSVSLIATEWIWLGAFWSWVVVEDTSNVIETGLEEFADSIVVLLSELFSLFIYFWLEVGIFFFKVAKSIILLFEQCTQVVILSLSLGTLTFTSKWIQLVSLKAFAKCNHPLLQLIWPTLLELIEQVLTRVCPHCRFVKLHLNLK